MCRQVHISIAIRVSTRVQVCVFACVCMNGASTVTLRSVASFSGAAKGQGAVRETQDQEGVRCPDDALEARPAGASPEPWTSLLVPCHPLVQGQS